MPSVTYSKEVFNSEITDTENKFKELTKEDMPKFFRPPMGKFSQKSLAMTKDLGYKSIFKKNFMTVPYYYYMRFLKLTLKF